ncbi:restriction endonuclease subunit S [Pedococcus sp. KACC 23699]|uniref:Restriction endonuclease subunit S n=1 Tax=Pedococcus sp. KACC 23699 TaxID=3149228 RepID=A0AAU7JXY0_9MICO
MRLTLGQAAEVRLGRQRSPEHEVGEHPAQYLRSANVLDGQLDLVDVKTMNFSPAEREIFALKDEDVLVTEGSGSIDTVGTSAVWRQDLPGVVCFQNTLLRLRPRTGITTGPYLAWWARHARLSGQIAAISSGANIKHLGSDGLKRLAINVPSLEDQRRIADFLDDHVARIDKIINARRIQQVNVRALWMSKVDEQIRDSAPSQRLAWSLSLSAVGVVVNPSTYFRDEGVPFVHGYNVRDGYLDLRDLKRMSLEDSIGLSRSRLREGDVLVVRAGYPGRAAVVGADLAGGNCASVLLLRPEPRLASHWLAAFFNSPLGKAAVERVQYGAAQGVINLSDVLAMSIPVPSIDEQHRRLVHIRMTEEAMRAGNEAMERQVAALVQYKQSLITAAVAGELDVTTAGSGIPG